MTRHLGIAGRTAALLILAAAAVCGAAGFLLYRAEERSERALYEGRAATLAAALQSSLVEAMSEHRPESMQAIVAAVARTEGVAGLALADRRGIVRIAAGEVPERLDVAATAPARGRPAFAWAGARLRAVRPIANAVACGRCHGA